MSAAGIKSYGSDSEGAYIEIGDDYGRHKFYGKDADAASAEMQHARGTEKVKNVARGVLLGASIVLFAVFVGSAAAHAANPHLGIAHLKSWKAGFGGGFAFGATAIGTGFAIHSGRTLRETLEKVDKKFETQSERAKFPARAQVQAQQPADEEDL